MLNSNPWLVVIPVSGSNFRNLPAKKTNRSRISHSTTVAALFASEITARERFSGSLVDYLS